MGVIARSRDAATDRDLVAAVRTGDDAAFEELYRRYSRRVAGYVYRKVGDHGRAEDITQEAFVSALRRMRQTAAEIAFKPWIFEIAKNAAIDHFRRASRAEEVPIHSGDGDDGGLRPGDHLRLVGESGGPDAALVSKERLDHLRSALAELSESHSRILVMRELEGLSYREIGERLALSRPAVESTLFRARRRLGQEYAELDTGARCLAMTAAIARLAEGVESPRDRRRLARHVRGCASCRRHARELGVSVESRPLRSRVAALLPLPGLLRRRRGGGADATSGTGGQGCAAGVQQAAGSWAPTLAPMTADSTAVAWSKAAAIVAAVALAGGGAAVHDTVVADDSGGKEGSQARAGEEIGELPPPMVELGVMDNSGPVYLSPRGTEQLPPAGAGSPAGAGQGGSLSGGGTGGRGSPGSGGGSGGSTGRDGGSSGGGIGTPRFDSTGEAPSLPEGGSGGGSLTGDISLPGSGGSGSGSGDGSEDGSDGGSDGGVSLPVTTPPATPPGSTPSGPPQSAPPPPSPPPVGAPALPDLSSVTGGGEAGASAADAGAQLGAGTGTQLAAG